VSASCTLFVSGNSLCFTISIACLTRTSADLWVQIIITRDKPKAIYYRASVVKMNRFIYGETGVRISTQDSTVVVSCACATGSWKFATLPMVNKFASNCRFCKCQPMLMVRYLNKHRTQHFDRTPWIASMCGDLSPNRQIARIMDGKRHTSRGAQDGHVAAELLAPSGPLARTAASSLPSHSSLVVSSY
jgi:hypothetical protein